MVHPEKKILNQTQAIAQVHEWKHTGLKLVFTNGCFDILHKGHADYLFRAKSLGDKLIVGVNSDDSVRRMQKSPARPLQDENGRAFLLASLACVDLVILFDEDTPLNLIKSIMPDVLVKGADYKEEEIIGYKEVIENNGKVITLSFIDGYSTSDIERKIRDSVKK